MQIHVTTSPAAKDIFEAAAIKIANTEFGTSRYTHRVTFKPITTGAGVVAKVAAPTSGSIGSVAVMLENAAAPTGDLILSVVDPDVHYNAAFLYAVTDGIPKATIGPPMWRKTEIATAYYSTIQVNNGFLYFIILNGPTGEFVADVALTAATV